MTHVVTRQADIVLLWWDILRAMSYRATAMLPPTPYTPAFIESMDIQDTSISLAKARYLKATAPQQHVTSIWGAPQHLGPGLSPTYDI